MEVTLDSIKVMDKEMLSPTMVAKIIGCNPYYITLQARKDPTLLGFPVHVHGSRTQIPRRAFIKFMEGGN